MEEERAKPTSKPEPEYGWVDDDGAGFDDNIGAEDANESVERAEDLTDLLVPANELSECFRIGMMVPLE